MQLYEREREMIIFRINHLQISIIIRRPSAALQNRGKKVGSGMNRNRFHLPAMLCVCVHYIMYKASASKPIIHSHRELIHHRLHPLNMSTCVSSSNSEISHYTYNVKDVFLSSLILQKRVTQRLLIDSDRSCCNDA